MAQEVDSVNKGSVIYILSCRNSSRVLGDLHEICLRHPWIRGPISADEVLDTKSFYFTRLARTTYERGTCPVNLFGVHGGVGSTNAVQHPMYMRN